VSKSKRNSPSRSIRVNYRGLLVVAVAVVVVGLGLFGLNVLQERRMTREAMAVAKRLHAAGDSELAVRHLSQHLALRPRDIEALVLKSEILAAAARGPAQMFEAIKVHEHLLRVAPDEPASQPARRRLVDLYVRYGDYNKASATNMLFSAAAALESRYRAAESVARQMIARGADDAGARRLLAMALDGMAVPGDRKALNDAIQEYRTVLSMDTGDEVAADRLSRLYVERLKDPVRAERVLDDLLKVRPKSVETRLCRHRFYVKLRRDDAATVELEEATKLAPDDLKVLLAAAENALRRGDTAGARRKLEEIPQKYQGDIRVLLTRGMIDFGDERPDEAVDAWRQGLMTSAGTDGEVTWWLAYALLQIGRVAEAKPLVAQYQRLAPEDAPMLLLLAAQLDEHTGRPARSVALLDRIHKRLDPRWAGMVALARGRCYEALWDDMKALEAYGQALQADPLSIIPRLAIAKIKLKRSPVEAIDEIERGLSLVPNDPALRIALAGSLLRKELMQPPSKRVWRDFDRALKKAIESAPTNSAVALMQADRLKLDGHDDQAVKYLDEVTKKSPKNAAIAIALADGLSHLNEHTRALEVLQHAIAPDAAGDQAALRIALSRTLTSLYRGREARAVLITDVDKLPPSDRYQVWVALGQLEMARGDTAAARRAFAEWSRLLPDDPRPRLVLVELAIDEGDEKTIHTLVDELLLVGGPTDVAFRLARAKELLHERNAANPPPGSRDVLLEEAGKLVDGVISDAPELPAAQMMRAEILERQGRFDEAIAAYQRSWERGTEAALPKIVELLSQRRRFDELARLRNSSAGRNPQLDLLSAGAFVRVGDRTQARQIAEQVAREMPDAADALGWQAKMLNQLGRVDDAESSLRALAERQPDVLQPWLALLRFQTATKRTQAATDTVARIKAEFRTSQPELLDARCAWAVGDRVGADKAFQAVLAKEPESVSLLIEAAQFYEQAERPLEAEALLRRVIALEPKNRPAVRQLAAVLATIRPGDPAAWDAAWASLGEETPETATPEDRLARAVVLFRAPDAARRAQAAARLDDLLADLPVKHPTATAARDLLARFWLDAGQSDRAARIAAVSSSQTGDPDAIALFAKALVQSKKPEAAEFQLNRLATINPGDPREANLRAQIIWDKSRPVEAAEALENAYSTRENLPGADRLGRETFILLASRGTDTNANAERVGRKLTARNPTNGWMPASILVRKGEYDQALDLLQKAVRPGAGVEDLCEIGKVAVKTASGDTSPETLKRVDAILMAAVALEPHCDELLVMTAMLRHIQSDFADEVRLYKAVLEHRPESYVVLNNLAWALSEGLNRPDEAIKLVDDLLKVAGRDVQSLDTRGLIFSRLGKHDDAIRDLEEVVKTEPDAMHHFHLARGYLAAGRRDDARKALSRARQLGLDPRQVDPAEKEELQNLLQLGS
jgi:tetratricopeptide (TPR) repeat protein